MLPGQSRYWRLDLKPDVIETPRGKIPRKDIHNWSPEGIFVEKDLYTTRWRGQANTEIERFFFGGLDTAGPAAVEYFSKFMHPSADDEAFSNFLHYLSVQKIRTPKGLLYLSRLARSENKNINLLLLQEVQDMFCAIWTECIWQIASAANSPTKFIISDHPVTVYNRACPPLSKWCKNDNDPDIRLHATHSYFPLSIDKVLILTNLSWVRNPYQKETHVRPNPHMFRQAMFNFTKIQVGRTLEEDEVLQINVITKRRAYRYVAAAEKDWLFPEKHVSTDYWKRLGNGYLLMPEPRLLHLGGEMLVGYSSGRSEAFSEYGHRPWQQGFKDSAARKARS
jgi:hypothetical protein